MSRPISGALILPEAAGLDGTVPAETPTTWIYALRPVSVVNSGLVLGLLGFCLLCFAWIRLHRARARADSPADAPWR